MAVYHDERIERVPLTTENEAALRARAARLSADKKAKNEGALFISVLSLLLVLPFARIEPWEAAGLYLLVRLFTYQADSVGDDKTPAERLGGAIAFGIVAPALTLGFAAIYHGFAS